jgi:hypothetical protein
MEADALAWCRWWLLWWLGVLPPSPNKALDMDSKSAPADAEALAKRLPAEPSSAGLRADAAAADGRMARQCTAAPASFRTLAIVNPAFPRSCVTGAMTVQRTRGATEAQLGSAMLISILASDGVVAAPHAKPLAMAAMILLRAR